jgi:putative transposase
MIARLRQQPPNEHQAGIKVPDLARKARNQWAHALPLESQVRRHGGEWRRRLRELEEENRRLKHMVADQALDIQALKAVLGKKW